MYEDKESARAALRAARASLSDEERARQNRLAGIGVLRSGLLLGTEVVALYAAIGDEADPSRIAEAARGRDIKTAYPRIDGDTLRFHIATPSDLTPTGPWKIPEPSPDAPLAEDIGLFVVPGLGFTIQGARIGYGRGYYDRILSKRGGAKAIGFGFDCQLVDELPVEKHDVELDAVVVGSRLVWVNP